MLAAPSTMVSHTHWLHMAIHCFTRLKRQPRDNNNTPDVFSNSACSLHIAIPDIYSYSGHKLFFAMHCTARLRGQSPTVIVTHPISTSPMDYTSQCIVQHNPFDDGCTAPDHPEEDIYLESLHDLHIWSALFKLDRTH